MKTTCTKKLGPFPFAHRQPSHYGHCALIHGHSWHFEITFEAERLDENTFVFDFGDLKDVREGLNGLFDHTLVLNQTDPQLGTFLNMQHQGLCKVTTVPSCSAEGLAEFVFKFVDRHIKLKTSDRVQVKSVKCFEEPTAFATYGR